MAFSPLQRLGPGVWSVPARLCRLSSGRRNGAGRGGRCGRGKRSGNDKLSDSPSVCSSWRQSGRGLWQCFMQQGRNRPQAGINCQGWQSSLGIGREKWALSGVGWAGGQRGLRWDLLCIPESEREPVSAHAAGTECLPGMISFSPRGPTKRETFFFFAVGG